MRVGQAGSARQVGALLGGPLLLALIGVSAVLALGGYWLFVVGLWCVYSLAALGLLFPAGWVGEISVGHAGIMAIAAYGTSLLTNGNALVELAIGAVFGMAAGFLLGLPSLRLRGFGLAIVTLIFGELVRVALGIIPGLGGATGRFVTLPTLLGSPLSPAAISIIAVLSLALALLVSGMLRGSVLGRSWRAVRDNEPLARAFGCDPRLLRVAAFTLSGVYCGLAGTMFGWLTGYIAPDNFNLWLSIYLLAIVVVGGRDELYGPLVGAALVVLAAEVLRLTGEIQAIGFGILLLLAAWFLPEGIVRAPLELLRRSRRAKARALALPAALDQGAIVGFRSANSSATALEAADVAKHYGGVRAVDGFSAVFPRGRVTAIVGPNGAGKTTLLDCLSGRAPISRGSIALNGQPVSALQPHVRARRGLARLFQEAELFRTLTVREALSLAFDVLGRPGMAFLWTSHGQREARKAAVDAALVRFNLAQVGDETLDKLSLGMSRVVGLACLHVSGADVWLLDEPASGLARAEVERMGDLLRSLAAEGDGRAIIMVEHDAGIVRAAGDRVILMESGRLIADAAKGSPAWDEVIEGRSAAARRAAVMPPPGAAETAPASATARHRLAGKGLAVAYGKFVAVRDIDLEVVSGEMRCLVGTNGAGKSTIMRCLAGLITPTRGEVLLDGAPLKEPAHARVNRHGIVMVAGGRSVFPHLTVAENLRLTTRPGAKDRFDLNAVFPELNQRMDQFAGSLSGGEQQMLAIARALKLRPRFLLVDELTLGLSELVGQRLLSVLAAACRNEGLGVLLVEQDYSLALRWSQHAFVVAQGDMIFSGPAAEALERPGLFRPVFLPAA